MAGLPCSAVRAWGHAACAPRPESCSWQAVGVRGSAMWGVGSVALGAALIGTIGTAAALGPDSLTATAVGSWRTLIGAVGLVLVSALIGQAFWKYPLPLRWLVLGGIGMAGSQISFFEAVTRTGVAVGTLVAIGTGPLAAGVIDWLAYQNRPTRHWLLGVAVALAGVVLLSQGALEVVWSGVAFGVAAGCFIPLFGFSAQAFMRDRPLLPAMTTVVASGAVLLSPLAVASAGTAFASVESTATLAYLGLATMAGAQTLWGAGLQRLSLSVVLAVTLLEPAVAATLAMTVLDEPVTAGLIAGICLVIAGVGITSFNPATRTDETGRQH